MGKTLNDLRKQLKLEDHRKDAENCIEIYNKLKDLEGHVWSSKWRALTTVVGFNGRFPNCFPITKPNAIGYSFIKS